MIALARAIFQYYNRAFYAYIRAATKRRVFDNAIFGFGVSKKK
jgi:hypothetical protein